MEKQNKKPRLESVASYKGVPAVPCAAGFDPAYAGGNLPDDFTLPEGYRVLIVWTRVPFLSTCWLKTPFRLHAHGRCEGYNTIVRFVGKGGNMLYFETIPQILSPIADPHSATTGLITCNLHGIGDKLSRLKAVSANEQRLCRQA